MSSFFDMLLVCAKTLMEFDEDTNSSSSSNSSNSIINDNNDNNDTVKS